MTSEYLEKHIKKAFGFLKDSIKDVRGNKGRSDAQNIVQYEKLKAQYAADEVFHADRIGSALKADPLHRAASYLSQEQLAQGRVYSLTGGDTKPYTLLQTQGQLNNIEEIFEYVLNPIGQVTHQRFIPGGIYTGFANQVVPRGGY